MYVFHVSKITVYYNNKNCLFIVFSDIHVRQYLSLSLWPVAILRGSVLIFGRVLYRERLFPVCRVAIPRASVPSVSCCYTASFCSQFDVLLYRELLFPVCRVAIPRASVPRLSCCYTASVCSQFVVLLYRELLFPVWRGVPAAPRPALPDRDEGEPLVSAAQASQGRNTSSRQLVHDCRPTSPVERLAIPGHVQCSDVCKKHEIH